MAGPEHQEDVKEHDDDDDDGEVEIVVGVLIVDCCSSHCLRRRFCRYSFDRTMTALVVKRLAENCYD